MIAVDSKSREYLDKALRSLRIADHMVYVTYPLLGDKKLIIKIFDEINKVIINCVRQVSYGGNWEVIFDRFVGRDAFQLGLSNEDIKIVKEIVWLGRKHHDSAMEFVRCGRVVIMGDDLGIQALDFYKVKGFLILAKELVQKVEGVWGGNRRNSKKYFSKTFI